MCYKMYKIIILTNNWWRVIFRLENISQLNLNHLEEDSIWKRSQIVTSVNSEEKSLTMIAVVV